MKMGFDIEGASPTAPDYRMLRAVLETRALVGRAPVRPSSDLGEIAACSFSRAGLAKLLGFELGGGDHGKDCLNLGGSVFGETGGVVKLSQPGDRADGGQERVQGSYA
jgi:hypothetical protein